MNVEELVIRRLREGLVLAKKAAMSGLPVDHRPAAVMLFPVGKRGSISKRLYMTMRFVGREGRRLPESAPPAITANDWQPRQGDLLIVLSLETRRAGDETDPRVDLVPTPFGAVIPAIRNVLLGSNAIMPELVEQRTSLILIVFSSKDDALLRREELFLPPRKKDKRPRNPRAPPNEDEEDAAAADEHAPTQVRDIAASEWDEILSDEHIHVMEGILKAVRPSVDYGRYFASIYQWRAPVARLRWAGRVVQDYGRAIQAYETIVARPLLEPQGLMDRMWRQAQRLWRERRPGGNPPLPTRYLSATGTFVGEGEDPQLTVTFHKWQIEGDPENDSIFGCFDVRWRPGSVAVRSPTLQLVVQLLHFYNRTFACIDRIPANPAAEVDLVRAS